jgi:protease-4
VIAGVTGDSTSLQIGHKVGVIEVVGPIVSSGKTVQEIVDFRKDSSIEAVVLRVDSPGGGVGPSQEIYVEIERLAKTKPVVVSMGGVAASGGYYIAAPADQIVANPGTITGSIGVIMGFTNYQELLDKIGLKSSVIKSGEHKDIGSPVRAMTEEDRAILQSLIDDVHRQFVEAIARGRQLDFDTVLALADGRIFSGKQAKELGLVDELGNFRDAITLAASLAEIEGEPKVVYPPREKPDFIEYFMQEAVGQFKKGLQEESSVGLQYLWNGTNGR